MYVFMHLFFCHYKPNLYGQVDPILRARLWQHLVELSSGPSATTVLVTTHYIEEARQVSDIPFHSRSHCYDYIQTKSYAIPFMQNLFSSEFSRI